MKYDGSMKYDGEYLKSLQLIVKEYFEPTFKFVRRSGLAIEPTIRKPEVA